MTILGREMNANALFVGLALRKKLLLQYSVSMKHFVLQIRDTEMNLEIIKITILGREMNTRVLFVTLAD